MTLPLAQSRVLRFVADNGPVTALAVTQGLRMTRGTAGNALRLLVAKGLTVADSGTWPPSYTATDEGKEALSDDEEDPDGQPVP